LLVVMPAQLIWAAAAPYCAHETSAAGKQHFGHHDHRHQADDRAAPDNVDESGPLGTFHADCEVCHLGASAAMPVPVVALDSPPLQPPNEGPAPRYTSHVPLGPERPDRADPTLPCDSVAASCLAS
jgi:hypothetical protein